MRHTRPAQPAQAREEERLETGGVFNKTPLESWRYGWLVRPGSLWVGAHWSPENKRLCINLLPCVTVWVVLPGGTAPS